MFTLMKKSDSPLDLKASRVSDDNVSNLHYAEVACFQLARTNKQSIQAKLGLKVSAQTLLKIIRTAQVSWQWLFIYYTVINVDMWAQSSKFYRASCNYVADQAFHLLNAVDGGIQGRAIDVNNILRDYITRLNQ